MNGATERARQAIPEAPEGAVGVRPILSIPDVLTGLGADPVRLFGAVGLHPDILQTTNGFIPMEVLGQLVQRAVSETGCPHFGLLVTRQTPLSALGVIGALMLQADTVGAALLTLGHFLGLQDRGAELTLSTSGDTPNDTATLGYSVFERGVKATDQIHDGSIVLLVNILRELCGPFWRPTEARFSRRMPRDVRPYREHFRCPLRFNAEQTALLLPARQLELPLWSAGAGLEETLRVRAEEVAGRGGMKDRVRRLLTGLVLTPSCKLEDAAHRLAVSRRTLNRQLEAEGTSFRALLEEVRFVRAQQLIINTNLPLGEIAAILHYSEASAFSRAFRRWAGVAPMEWRG